MKIDCDCLICQAYMLGYANGQISITHKAFFELQAARDRLITGEGLRPRTLEEMKLDDAVLDDLDEIDQQVWEQRVVTSVVKKIKE